MEFIWRLYIAFIPQNWYMTERTFWQHQHFNTKHVHRYGYKRATPSIFVHTMYHTHTKTPEKKNPLQTNNCSISMQYYAVTERTPSWRKVKQWFYKGFLYHNSIALTHVVYWYDMAICLLWTYNYSYHYIYCFLEMIRVQTLRRKGHFILRKIQEI